MGKDKQEDKEIRYSLEVLKTSHPVTVRLGEMTDATLVVTRWFDGGCVSDYDRLQNIERTERVAKFLERCLRHYTLISMFLDKWGRRCREKK